MSYFISIAGSVSPRYSPRPPRGLEPTQTPPVQSSSQSESWRHQPNRETDPSGRQYSRRDPPDGQPKPATAPQASLHDRRDLANLRPQLNSRPPPPERGETTPHSSMEPLVRQPENGERPHDKTFDHQSLADNQTFHSPPPNTQKTEGNNTSLSGW